MIVGSHVIIYSRNADADRAFFRDVLKFTHVDVGHGWLIFGLPPSEVAVHPAEGGETHEFYLMCKDVKAFVQAMKRHSLTCSPVREERWGLLTQLTLPGGGALGVYQPRHARPKEIATAGRAVPPRRSPKAPKNAPRRKLSAKH
jgi:catechol 2,3-dioxygenase-like lactoylglutathione lyase family enzyme